VELRRRSTTPQNINRLLDDLSSLTEFEPKDWVMHYEGETQSWSEEAFAKTVPLTPNEYRRAHDEELNEWRTAAGLKPRRIHEASPEVQLLQSMAGLR
jgi:hypothetical protein